MIMRGAVYTVRELADKESELRLYDGNILGTPVWRLLRFKIRTNYYKKNTEFNNKSNKKEEINKVTLVKCFFNSFYKLANLLIVSEKRGNIVFAFPRLAKLNDIYLDKFTDPVIEYTDIRDDFLIFQRSLSGIHNKPRCHDKQTIETDFIDITAKILGVILFPIFFLCYMRTILRIYKKTKDLYALGVSFIITSSAELGEFYVKHTFVKLILSKLKARNIFIVNRGAFAPVIVSARKLNAKVYEMQHGISLSDTILYAGQYHPIADPDYFLVFGEKWIASQFYMPLEKIINIGWAYKRMVKNSLQLPDFPDNCILVISSPSCTFKLFKLVVKLAKEFPKYEFHIRLHPQEGYRDEQYKAIEQIDNISMDNHKVDSAVVIHQYKYIVGENSSVLYEALCLNKRDARLDMEGIVIKDQNNNTTTGFSYVKNMKDFKDFLNPKEGKNDLENLGIYDDFKEEVVNTLIKN